MIRELIREKRTAVVAAHPDDESAGAGCLIRDLRRASFIYLTDGAPRNGADAAAHGFFSAGAYHLERLRELRRMLDLAGIPAARALLLNLPDQQASLHLVRLAAVLRFLITELGLQVVLTHPYEGGHPDHDAAAFAVHAACMLVPEVQRPLIVEMTGYHNGPEGIVTSVFLPTDGTHEKSGPKNGAPGKPSDRVPHETGNGAETIELTPEQQAFKRGLMECYPTQRQTLRFFPVTLERFRRAPGYDFTAPPHPGALFYEGFSWGMDGPRFRQLARCALDQLDLRCPL